MNHDHWMRASWRLTKAVPSVNGTIHKARASLTVVPTASAPASAGRSPKRTTVGSPSPTGPTAPAAKRSCVSLVRAIVGRFCETPRIRWRLIQTPYKMIVPKTGTVRSRKRRYFSKPKKTASRLSPGIMNPGLAGSRQRGSGRRPWQSGQPHADDGAELLRWRDSVAG
jgi:hypothetical protein